MVELESVTAAISPQKRGSTGRLVTLDDEQPSPTPAFPPS